ncbi:MAG: hypothetical protein KGQ51_12730 [Planctomycetes bacterium]|nr:hypothetical protein [Planctomycetota bacterium]
MKPAIPILLIAFLGTPAIYAEDRSRPRFQCINGSDRTIEVFWIRDDQQRVSNGKIASGGQVTIDTQIGHQFAIVDSIDQRERIVECSMRIQAFRYESADPHGIPAFYTQRVFAHGYPIVGSANVNQHALHEAAFWIDQMLAHRPDIRDAMIQSGSRLCVIAWNEFTTDLPEFSWLGNDPVAELPSVNPKDYWDARARGLGGSESDPLCSCGEENLLAYPGDPYSSECILIHEFAHNIHLRGLVNIDPTFDGRLKTAYQQAMKAGLWKGKYASVNHHEYFAEGVQSWFNNNRENDHDHNHVNTREELEQYDPLLAAICKEVFGETHIVYTKPPTRLQGHLQDYDPREAPEFRWPKRLEQAHERILESARKRSESKP